MTAAGRQKMAAYNLPYSGMRESMFPDNRKFSKPETWAEQATLLNVSNEFRDLREGL